ncbi:MAG: PAS domain-containing protein [Desulfobulbaceae bacterium]|nr:PAS domain-containing protein [Desulfobulbaceae bacterium]
MENKLIVGNLPEPVIITNEQGLIRSWNSAAASSFALDDDSFVGRPLREVLVVHPDPGEDIFVSLAAAPAGARLEITICRPDGSLAPFEFLLTRIDNGESPILILSARDISDRWLREKKLNLSYQNQKIMNSILQISLMPVSLDQQLELILDQILTIPTIALLPNGAILLAESLPGILVLKAQRGFSDQQLATCARVPFGKCHCGRAAQSREIQFVHCIDEKHDFVFDRMQPHGHYCVPIIADDALLGVIALYIQHGHKSSELEMESLHAIANVLAGIIERKKMEGLLVELIEDLKKTVKELDEARRFNESVIASLGSGLVVVNAKGVVEKSNPAARQLLGRLFAGRVDGAELVEILGAAAAGEVARAGESGNDIGRREMAVREIGGGKELIFEYATVPREDMEGGQVGKIISFTDVTGLRKIQAEMEKMNRFSTIAEIASAVAHEVRNPLAGIRTMTQVIDEQLSDGEPHKEYTRRIIKQVDRLNELLTDFFTYARPPVPKRRPIPLRRVMEEIKPLVHSRLQKNSVSLVEEYEENLPDILADPSQVQQVFLNLFLNALVAMKGTNGRITVRARSLGAECSEFDTGKLTWLRPNGRYVTVYFSDNGCGMEPEILEKVFEPFFTTRHDGTGLGLSIVYRILKENNAGIMVRSAPGQGATFIVFFSVD